MTLPKTSDRIRATTVDNSFEGRMMPDEPDTIIIKLDNGYNIGIKKANIRELSTIEEYEPNQPKAKHESPQDSRLPKISILHTGGTIASKVDYETGGVIARFSPEELLALFPELHHLAHISSRLIRNMWSDDLRFAHINIIAQEVRNEIEAGAKGIIVTMGTDNLSVASAGLAFALQNIPIPVIFVGAQRSSDRGSSDAAVNLICAARFITKSKFTGPAVCMHESESDDNCLILSATQTRKMHSSRRDAFKPVNQGAFARVSFETGEIAWLRNDYPGHNDKKMDYRPFNEKLHVGHLKAHINMFATEISAYEGFDGLILEGTGLGHFPINEIDDPTKEHVKIFNALKELLSTGTVIAMSTQAIFGTVNMNVYSPGRRLQSIGVLGNLTDMPPETAYVKLAWLLSHVAKEQVHKYFGENIVGEISARRDSNTSGMKGE